MQKNTAKFWAIIIIPNKVVYVVIRIFNKIAG